MKKQYLLFMAIINFVACPLEEGIRPFDGSRFASLLTTDGRLNTALFKSENGESPNIGPNDPCIIRLVQKDQIKDYYRKMNATLSVLSSQTLFTMRAWEENDQEKKRLIIAGFMFDPETELDLVSIDQVPLRDVPNLLNTERYAFIEQQALYFRVVGNLVTIWIRQNDESHKREHCSIPDAYGPLINTAYLHMLGIVNNTRCTVLDGVLHKGGKRNDIVPSRFTQPLTHPADASHTSNYWTTSDEIIAHITRRDNIFLKFVRDIRDWFGDSGFILSVRNELHILAEMDPQFEQYPGYWDNIVRLPLPVSHSEIALRLDPLMPLLIKNTNEGLKHITNTIMSLLKNCDYLGRSGTFYYGLQINPLISHVKSPDQTWQEFLRQFDLKGIVCPYFDMQCVPGGGMAFEKDELLGADKLAGIFADRNSLEEYYPVSTAEYYPVNNDSIPTEFENLIGYLADDGTIKWKVKFLPVALTNTQANWVQTLRELPDNKMQDLKNRLLMTGEALRLNPNMNDSENVPAADFDAVTGPVYTIKNLRKLPPTDGIILTAYLNPNGNLKIKANVPQAAPGPVVAPAPVVEQNAAVAPRTMPKLEEIHQLNIQLGPLGSLKWTGNKTVKQQSGGPVHELSNFMNGTLIPDGFKAISIQLSIENMRELLGILNKCEQGGHFIYAVLPKHAIKGDLFFVGRNTQGLYAGCIRKGKLYLEE